MATIFATGTVLVASVFAPAAPNHNSRPGCRKTFTAPMIKRAVDAAYHGTRTVTARDRAHLRRYIHCARNLSARPAMRRYLHNAWRAWKLRRDPPIQGYWLASWYTDGGGHCCGYYATYGVAMCGSAGPCYPQGTRIELFYHRRRVLAVVDDHGPYAGNRNIDLGANVAAALGFGGVGMVGYHVL